MENNLVMDSQDPSLTYEDNVIGDNKNIIPWMSLIAIFRGLKDAELNRPLV